MNFKDKALELNNLTIVIPTYNRLKYLEIILNSIPKFLKVRVGDNGPYIPDDFPKKFPHVKFDKRDQLLSAVKNWNECMKMVETEFFMIPSDDDLYYEDSFMIAKQNLESFPDADIFCFGHNVINENGQIQSTWLPPALKRYDNPLGFYFFKYGVDGRLPSIIFRTSLVKKLGYLDEVNYKLTAADSKLIQQCALYGTLVTIPQILGAYRTWANNSTVMTLGTKKWLEEIDYWQDEILKEAKTAFSTIKGETLDGKKIKDEVYAINLIAGIGNNRTHKGFWAAVMFFKSVRFPSHSKLTTKLRILKALIR